MCHHYKNQSVNSVQGITAANSKNHMKSINTFYGQYADSLNVKASGIYSYHYVLNINWILPKGIRPKIHNKWWAQYTWSLKYKVLLSVQNCSFDL